jgi:Family of unknown function (DUF6011)
METTNQTGGYENAPATKMLATYCAVCRRDLVDAISVEFWIGPECRKRHGFNEHVSETDRAEANAIVHRIAVEGWTVDSVRECERLRGLGFAKLATIIEDCACPVRIETTLDGRLAITSPYNEDAVAYARRIPGRRWDGEKKVNTFPPTERPAVLAMLQRFYSGLLAFGPKGAFVI